ncbi:MAG: hypothetical protein FJW77_04150 [Actinobacteria bacterium]|nr:hypothetical protein [Actinomycetota bacterium]
MTPVRRRLIAVGAFPAALLLLTLVLGLAGISGSSVARHDPGAEPAVGRTRAIRYDEFQVRTPLVVRQAELGFPARSWVGVGEHDMGLLANLPVAGWPNLVRPHQVPYRVLGVDQAFALEWWLVQFALPAIGVYALLLACRTRIVVAALAGLAFACCPAMQWWTSTGLGTVVGYLALAGAVALWATRARSPGARVGLGALAGWLGACGALVLYLPWVVPVALIVGALVVAAFLAEPGRPRSARSVAAAVLPVAVAAAVVGGILVVAFLGAHADALRAVADSVYPGRRREAGGEGGLRLLLGAPFDVIAARDPAALPLINGVNQSEASGGVFLLAAVAAALAVDARHVCARPWRARLPLGAVLVTGAGLVAWYLLPVPAAVGGLVGFDRIPSYRLLPPIALASVLALALYVEARDRWRPPLRDRGPLVGVGVFAVGTVWAAAVFTVDGRHGSVRSLAVLSLLFVAAVGWALWRGAPGLGALVVVLAVGAVLVNPVQHGLGPLRDGPAAQLGRELRDRPGAGRVVVFANDPAGDITALAGITAGGVDNVSAVNLYPNPDAWRVLDPTGVDRTAWDRYANALWGVAPEGAAPRVFLETEDTVIVMVDPCDPALAGLGVRTVVSRVPLTRACLTATDRVRAGAGALYVYRVDRARVPGAGR